MSRELVYRPSRDDDEPPPTLGVREPRRPKPSNLSGGAAADPEIDAYLEAEALAESPRIVISVRQK